jgi:hypothetical protein
MAKADITIKTVDESLTRITCGAVACENNLVRDGNDPEFFCSLKRLYINEQGECSKFRPASPTCGQPERKP